MITFLEWDTRFFGLKIGKVEIYKATIDGLAEIEKQKVNNKFDLLYLFINKIDNSVFEWFVNKGARYVDQKVTYRKTIDEFQPQNRFTIVKFDGIISPKLLQLAVESGHKSRFKKDIRLNTHFEEMYRIWIKKCVNGELADIVMISLDNSDICGFITIKTKNRCGEIGLIAVDKNFRGRGIGKELLIAAENWCTVNKFKEISVETQFENSEACKLYERNGYDLIRSQNIFHY